MGRLLFAIGIGLVGCSATRADSFGSGVNSFSIDFVSIGNPGNPPDANPNPAGAVAYPYRIGKYEISEQMIDKANALGGLGITKDTRGPEYPATSVTWYEAAMFVNWLDTSTGSVPAYKFDASGNFQLWTPIDPGYNPKNLYRNSLAHYFLPSIDEWHKAAYYDPVAGVYHTYPTGSDSVPDGIDFPGDPNFDAVFYDGGLNSGPNIVTNVGLLSRYGTAGQAGNVSEWIETAVNTRNANPADSRAVGGGSWVDVSTLMANWNIPNNAPFDAEFWLGLRVASVVPEPGAIETIALGLLLTFGFGRRTYSY